MACSLRMTSTAERGVLKIVLERASFVLPEGCTSLILGRGEESDVGKELDSKTGKKLCIGSRLGCLSTLCPPLSHAIDCSG